jgi:hypothetical protein
MKQFLSLFILIIFGVLICITTSYILIYFTVFPFKPNVTSVISITIAGVIVQQKIANIKMQYFIIALASVFLVIITNQL